MIGLKEKNKTEGNINERKSLKWLKPNIYGLGMEIRRETREDKRNMRF